MTAYLAIGASFVVTAGLGLRRGGLRLLVLTSILAATVLFVIFLRKVPPGDDTVGFVILLSIVAPAATAVVMKWLGTSTSRLALAGQWVTGMIAWVLSYVFAGTVSVFLGWIWI